MEFQKKAKKCSLLFSLGIPLFLCSQTNSFPDNGNVGIGTTSPASQLDVRTSDNKGIWINRNNQSAITFWPNNGNSVFHLSHGHDNKLYLSQGSVVGSGKLMTFVNSGNVGLGTTTPSSKFHVFTNGNQNGLIVENSSPSFSNSGLIVNNTSTTNGLLFKLRSSGVDRFIVNGSGNVGIGTTYPDAKLTVKGNIHAEEVKVDLSVPGPDYVFKEGYDLKSLEEVQNYIKEHGHLPNIPSAKEMETNGIQLGEMNMKLLEKIEELTLYIILLEKKNKIMEAFEARLKKLENKS